jgi:hypothetical protein
MTIRAEDLRDDEDDEISWDEWLELSDAEIDGLLETSMREAVEARARCPASVLYAHDRKNKLISILRWRALTRAQRLTGGFFADQLRSRQRALVALRARYYHGTVGITQ